MSGTTILIGADGGLGLAVAEALGKRDIDFAATVRTRARAIAREGPLSLANAVHVLDLDDSGRVAAAMREICREAGRVDAIIVCAAVPAIGALEHIDYAALRRAIEINCLSSAAIFQGSAAALRASAGRLIFTSSVTGRVASPLQGAYAASKFALEGAADVMRQEAAPWGVDIIIVEPGGIATPMVEAAIGAAEAGLRAHSGSVAAPLYAHFASRARAAIDSGDLSAPADVARTLIEALEAAQPKTRYVVGRDAEALLEAQQTLGTEALDAMLLGAFGCKAPDGGAVNDERDERPPARSGQEELRP